jgi:hypothetical protein
MLSKILFIVMVTLTFDLMSPKINTVLPLPQGNHVAKFGQDPLYRTKFIVWKRSCCHKFYLSVSRRAVLCDWVWRAVGGGRPHRFPHDNFSFVYWIFTKLGHMIPLWKGKNPIYFGVIRSKVKVTITVNRIFDNRIVSTR